MGARKMGNFLSKLKPRDFVVYLSQGFFDGKPTWHYLEVNKMKLPLLLKEAGNQQIDLVNYGKIVFSGFGNEPPASVKQYLEKKYGNR